MASILWVLITPVMLSVAYLVAPRNPSWLNTAQVIWCACWCGFDVANSLPWWALSFAATGVLYWRALRIAKAREAETERDRHEYIRQWGDW